jgi:hypothetical protein
VAGSIPALTTSEKKGEFMWWDLDNMVWTEAAIKLQKEIEQGVFKWVNENFQKEGGDVTKNEQNHFKQMIKVLDEFIEDAGVLHPTQYDRISGVRALLAEMAAEKMQEEQKWYRIYWEEAGAYFAGLVTEEGHPFWTRDPVQGQQYTIDRANEYLGKLKNVEGMTLDIRLVDDGEEEEAVKAGDFVGDGVKAIKEEAGTLVKIDPARKVVTDIIPENNKPECGLKEIPKEEYYVIQRCSVFVGPDTAKNGTHALLVKDAMKFSLAEEALTYIAAQACVLWSKGIWNGKPEVRKVTVEDGSILISAPIEQPEEERKYGVRIADDVYVVQHGDGYWGWNPLREGINISPRKFTLSEAEWILRLYLDKPNQLKGHRTSGNWPHVEFLGVVEISADYKEVKPVKYRVKLKDGMYLHRDGICPLDWSWSNLDGWGNEKHKPRLYATREEAQDRLDAWRQQPGWAFVTDKDAACVEVVT